METIQTKKFMDNTLSFRQMLPLERQTITALNLLILMMRGRSEKYPTRDAWSRAVNHAYASRFVTGLTGYGNQVLFDTRVKYLRPEYIDNPGYTREVVDLTDQALNRPVLDEIRLNEAKYLLKNRLLSARENPDVAAVQEALRIAQPGHKIGIPVGGILEDVDTVTLEDIHHLWEKLNSIPYTIYRVGQFSQDMEDFLATLPQSDEVRLDMELLSPHAPQFSVLRKDLSQSSLAQVYATGIRPGTQEFYALMLMNAVLGASPMSMLFEEVREKHSYCYSISSSLIRYDGAVLILTGTNKENLNHVEKLIALQIDKLKNMDFSDEKLEAARLSFIDGITAQQDMDLAMINQKFVNDLLNRQISSEKLISIIQSITKEQVAAAAARMQLVSQAIVEETGNHPEEELPDEMTAEVEETV